MLSGLFDLFVSEKMTAPSHYVYRSPRKITSERCQAVLTAIEYLCGRGLFVRNDLNKLQRPPEWYFWDAKRLISLIKITTTQPEDPIVYVKFDVAKPQDVAPYRKTEWLCECAVHQGKVAAASFNRSLITGENLLSKSLQEDTHYSHIAISALTYCFTRIKMDIDWEKGLILNVMNNPDTIRIHGLIKSDESSPHIHQTQLETASGKEYTLFVINLNSNCIRRSYRKTVPNHF